MATASSISPAPVIPGRITATALSKILLDPAESNKVAVIDVRGEGMCRLHSSDSISSLYRRFFRWHRFQI